MSTPQYLARPKTNGSELRGRVVYRDGYYTIMNADPAVLELAKRVFPGSRTRKDDGVVRFRATTRAVGDLNWLMLRFPMKIEDVRQYGKHRMQAIEHAERREKNQHIEPAGPIPSFRGQLMPYQATGVSFLEANRRCLLADDMGLGKTVTTLATLAKRHLFPAVLVVPNNVRIQWQRQAGVFLNLKAKDDLFHDETGQRIAAVLHGLTPYEVPERHLYILHYGLLDAWHKTLMALNPRAVVFDEIQELRHTGTNKYSAASLLAGETDFVFGLSGTPIYNYGAEIWSVLNILDFHCLGDYESFTREWCNGYGNKIVAKPAVLNDHLLKEGLMLRRVKADVQGQLPPKRRVVEYIDHDESLYQHLIKSVKEKAARYDQTKGWHERGELALQIDAESRQATGVAKAPYVGAFVADLLAAGERPLVYAWHHAVHDEIAAKVQGHEASRITGRESPKEKDEAIQKFRQGATNWALLSLRATAGIDGLQERATCVVFAELDWSPAVHSQCEDRAHRIGLVSVDSLLCYYLVSQTGYDGVVMDALGLKVGQFVGLMGDKAETEEDRTAARAAARSHIERIIRQLGEEAA